MSTSPDPVDPSTFVCGRRLALLGVGAVGATTLVGCGSSDSGTSVGSGSGSGAAAGSTPVAAGSIPVSDVPVGGGAVFDKLGVIVTQPEAGTFKAFSNVCTHQGSPIDSVHDGVMECPLHHSKFSIKDGSVVQGPATQPLASKTVTVSRSTLSVS